MHNSNPRITPAPLLTVRILAPVELQLGLRSAPTTRGRADPVPTPDVLIEADEALSLSPRHPAFHILKVLALGLIGHHYGCTTEPASHG